jgi:hypothetical protein
VEAVEGTVTRVNRFLVSFLPAARTSSAAISDRVRHINRCGSSAASSFATNQRKTNETNVSFMMMRARVGGNVVATNKITMNDGWLR